MAYDDDYRFHPDPVLLFTVPQDGEYVIEIKDAIYRGRPDFVYRITLGELPFVTQHLPAGRPRPASSRRRAEGLEPPGRHADDGRRGQSAGTPSAFGARGDMISNTRALRRRHAAGVPRSRSPTIRRPTAQPVTLPVIVNGRIDRPGDWDVFRFEGRAGQRIVAEVRARRLDSPLDSVLKLTDAAGKRLAFNDDHEDKRGR